MRGSNPRPRPDWGEETTTTPDQKPGEPTAPEVHHPHAPVEIPPDTAPPMPEKMPIGDPKPHKADLATSWPRLWLYC
jgi:hypothetical protein